MTRVAPCPGVVLGMDVGMVRVGVAGSDETRTVASPLTVLRRDRADFWRRVGALYDDRSPALTVVGLPLRAAGDEGDAATMARAFAAELERRTDVPTVFWDERFTTVQAERELIAAGVRRARRREHADAVAATLLLRSWLERQGKPAAR